MYSNANRQTSSCSNLKGIFVFRPSSFVVRLGNPALELKRPHRIRQQHRDRHRAHAARHRRDRACDLGRLGEVHVADETEAALARVIDPVDADVDHRTAGLQPRTAHEFRPADGRYHDVGAAYLVG